MTGEPEEEQADVQWAPPSRSGNSSPGLGPHAETIPAGSTLPKSGFQHDASANPTSKVIAAGIYWGGRTRTSNFLINSQAVCQLTYTP